MKNTFEKLFDDHAEFSNKTFGSDRSFTGPLHHLKKEVEELIENPLDDHEYADCFFLIIDAYRRKGGSPEQFLESCFEKLEINKTRKWGKPDKNGVIEHISELSNTKEEEEEYVYKECSPLEHESGLMHSGQCLICGEKS